jgi:glycosyltransferase involved in cell wall biosynthesis
MKEKINIIQILPYYPPHKWGLETNAQEWAENWIKKWYWKVINITTNIWTDYEWKGKIFKEEKNWIITYYLPSIEIIWNFPVYKFWKKEVRQLFKDLWKQNLIIITRTRFFLTTLIWWIFARKYKKKWIHIEHWSWYVKLTSKFKTFIAWLYDQIIWKWIFKKTNKIIPISYACKNFVLKLWWNKINLWPVIYRWFNFINLIKKNKLIDNLEEIKKINNWKKERKIILWFVWRIYKWKWVKNIIKWLQKIYSEDVQKINKIKLVVVWDGEDLERLKKLSKQLWLENNIYFTWW